MSQKPILIPEFGQHVIEGDRKDGYWVETFHFDKPDLAPGIITSGLVSGLIEFLENPVAQADPGELPNPETTWKKYEIGKFDSPVAVVAVDITRNGRMDLVICHDYGPFMLECNPDGGIVSWLENPGRDDLDKGHWTERFIGRWPAMHRMKAGYFTQKTFLEIIAASVVYGPHDKLRPLLSQSSGFKLPIREGFVTRKVEWHRDVVDNKNFTVIHEITSRKFDGPDGLDSMLIASREGTTRLYFEDNIWKRDLIGIGEPKGPRQSSSSESPGSGDHWGTGCLDAGKIGDDPFAYIATLDPFHGTTACVYTKTNRGIKGNQWKRHVLDVYGTPNQLKHTGDGPGHYIVCADFDGDGDDEFLLALFGSLDRDKDGNSIDPKEGPNPNKGIMYYKAIDLEKGVWVKFKIAEISSARIALGDFARKGRIDFASMSYNVARYYVEPNPKVTIHLNNFAPSVSATDIKSAITPTVWSGEGLVYLPYPATVHDHLSQPLIEVANYAIYIDVLPPGSTFAIKKQEEGIKVLYGSISDCKGKREPYTVPSFTKALCTSEDGCITADEKTGSIVLRFIPVCEGDETWKQAIDVPVNAKFDVSKHGVTLEPLKFTKVDQLWWGKGDIFKEKDFYNMTGFSFRLEDQTRLAHLQFWTAGEGVNCGVHNHSDAMFEEIHVCLSPGTKNGGMYRLKDEHVGKTPDELNNLGADAFDILVLGRLDEHGGMWKRDTYGKAERTADGVVVYPYHKWQGGDTDGIDIWAAIEFNPDLNV